MNDIAIRCEGLGKQYRIGERERYKALRDTITDTLSAPFRRLRANFNGEKSTPANGNNTFWALKDISFEVKHGEVVGIIGRNGAGKSTLLKILSRITSPTTGEVKIHGRVGSLLEVGTGFHPELTGRENIYLNGTILGMKKREIERKFDEIVSFAEIEKFLDTPVKRYSSGMYVRLAFAVAAHLEPEILVVDEVLAVGDAAFQKRCLRKLGDVAKEGQTVVFVSHDMTAIQLLCSRAFQLRSGKLVDEGPAAEQVASYLKATKNLIDINLKNPIRLCSSLYLNRFDFSPNPFVSGNSLELMIELCSSQNSYIKELAVIIYDSLGRRVALIDLRSPTGFYKIDGINNLNFTVDIRSLPLVEGDYYVGFWIDSETVTADLNDLCTLSVISNTDGKLFVSYPARARGVIELDYTIYCQQNLCTSV